jgi:hypothetical protein
MHLALLQISDGVTTIDLLNCTGWNLKAWRPALPQLKAGGYWQDSPLADGRQLVDRRRMNAVETFTLQVAGTAQDSIIANLQDLLRLLEQGQCYWIDPQSDAPVWIAARSAHETNTRYALVKAYQMPDVNDPYKAPFTDCFALTELTLSIERGDWQAGEPGDSTCILANTLQDTLEFNLILNSSFEVLGGGGADIWAIWAEVPDGGALADSATAHTGTHAAKFTGLLGGSGAIYIYQNIQVQPGETYTIDLWTRGDASGADNNYVGHYTLNTTGGVILQPARYFTGMFGIVYTHYTDTFIAPAGNPNLQVQIHASNATGTLTYVDDVRVQRLLELGQEGTCAAETFVVNKHQLAQLTDIYWLTAAGALSQNLIDVDLPEFLVPSAGVVVSNDALYFGIQEATSYPGSTTGEYDSAPFSGLVFDVESAMVYVGGATAKWQYYNGAWIDIPAIDDQTATAQPLDHTGVSAVQWAVPADWIPVGLSTVVLPAYWVRLIFTIGGGASIPIGVEVNHRAPYAPNVPFIDFTPSGDLPALLAINAIPYGALNQDFTRILVGARRVSRGDQFTAFRNASDKNTHYSTTVGANTAIIAEHTAPGDQIARYTPVGVEAIANRLNLEFDGDWLGTYHVFVRVMQTGGVAGDFSLRVTAYIFGMVTAMATTITVATTAVGVIEAVDLGRITVKIPVSIIPATTGQLRVEASATGAVGILDIYDVIFLPVDEWAADIIGTLDFFGAVIDSASDQRVPIQALDAVGNTVYELPLAIANGPAASFPEQTRLWFFRVDDPYFERTMTVQLTGVQRYLALRGAR